MRSDYHQDYNMGFDSSLNRAMVCYGMGMLVSSLLRPLLVELSSSLLEVVLAGRLAETLSHDRALFKLVSCVRGQRARQWLTGLALWSWAVALPPLVALCSTSCIGWVDAFESEDSFATMSVRSGGKCQQRSGNVWSGGTHCRWCSLPCRGEAC